MDINLTATITHRVNIFKSSYYTYHTVSVITHLPILFLPSDILWEYRVELAFMARPHRVDISNKDSLQGCFEHCNWLFLLCSGLLCVKCIINDEAYKFVKPLSHQGGVLTATARRARKTQNAELRAVRSPRAPRDRRGIAVASPLDAVGSPRTPCQGAHFVHAQSARRGSAFPRRSEWAPCERRGFAAATQ